MNTFKPFKEFTKVKSITLLVGPPACGKSTWCQKNAKNATIVSRDDIVDHVREEYHVSYSEAFRNKDLQKRVDKELESHLSHTLKSGRDIVIDMTNMSIKRRKSILDRTPAGYEKIAVVFSVSRAELIKRLDKREKETGKRVGINIVDDMLANYQEPSLVEGFDKIIMM